MQSLKSTKDDLPPLFLAHGECDQLILHKWGLQTEQTLTSLGVNTVFHSLPCLQHSMCRQELVKLKEWINTLLPSDG